MMVRASHRRLPERIGTLVRQGAKVIWGLMLLISLELAAREPKRGYGPAAQLSNAPPAARSLVNPFAGQAEAAAAGRKLYKQHCAECHGLDRHGLGRAVDLHSVAIQSAQPGVLFWAIRNGRIRKGMHSWSRLPDEQIWQIVAYLQMPE